jgi:hypothetical protein
MRRWADYSAGSEDHRSLFKSRAARPLTARLCSQLWGRLPTCGGLITRLFNCKQASQRRLPTGRAGCHPAPHQET